MAGTIIGESVAVIAAETRPNDLVKVTIEMSAEGFAQFVHSDMFDGQVAMALYVSARQDK